MTFPLEQSEGLASLLSGLGFFSNTVICGGGGGTPATDHRIWICGVGVRRGGAAFGAQSWNFFNGNRMALNGKPLGGPISIKMTSTDTCVSGD